MTDRLRRLAAGLQRGVTPLGRGVVSLGLTAYVFTWSTGLAALAVVAALCLLLVLVGLVAVWVPVGVRASLTLRPDRTSAGGAVQGRLRLRNPWLLPLARPVLEVPSGAATRWLRLPTVAGRSVHEEPFVVPAPRRGVVTVGPVQHRRTDPLGLFSRRVAWTGAATLMVRPASVDLAGLPLGQLHDLEGVPSDQVSMSDLAFHALRAYVPGDDLRHVHWRTSARAGQLVVRQYHDTRRTSALLVVDDRRDAYADPEDFELALSVAASLARRAARDGYDLALACGGEVVRGDAERVLDALCRADLRDEGPEAGTSLWVARGTGLPGLVGGSLLATGDASVLFLLTGTAVPVPDVQRVVELLPADQWTGVVRCGAERGGLAEYAGRPVLTLSALTELPVALAEVVR